MEYLVNMTTQVPDGTSEETIAEVRTREAPWLTEEITQLVPDPSDPAVPGSRPGQAGRS